MNKNNPRLYQKPDGLAEKIKDWQEPKFSDGARQVLERRYLMKNPKTEEVIETPKEMLYRVASVISEADKIYDDFDPKKSEREFYDVMAEGKFFPNSPTLKGAGLDINLAACYVIPIEDSREGIFKEGLYNAISVQAYGGGTGFNWSQLRPEGSIISTTGGASCGPIPFMKIFDYAIGPVIAQGGTRNGANMAILRFDHPDILKFIDCKATGGITNFNISVGVTEKFMAMAEKGEEYSLWHPKWDGHKKLNAKEVLDKITYNAWKNGDPGLIFLDRLEKDNPTPHIGIIDATNPCGEQPLLPLEACNLGSINLLKFVETENDEPSINYQTLKETVHTTVHYLDNVIDINHYPLEKTDKEVEELRIHLKNNFKDESKIEKIVGEWAQSPIEKTVKGNRKIGLGVMGFASMLLELGIPYGSEKSLEIADEVMGFIQQESRNASIKLAESRGVFSNWEESTYDSKSEYFKGEELKLRNATTNTIAPTGSLSIFAGVSSGIEPLIALSYARNTVYNKDGKSTITFGVADPIFEAIAKSEGFYSKDLIQKIGMNKGSIRGLDCPEEIDKKRWVELQNLFITAHDLNPKNALEVQKKFQDNLENAVSKTINLPYESTVEEVKKIYKLADEMGVKGVTVYRDGSKENQVLTFLQEEEISMENPYKPPEIMPAIKVAQRSNRGKIHAFVTFDEQLKPRETFAVLGNAGSHDSAALEAIGKSTSKWTRSGGDLKEFMKLYEEIGSGEATLSRSGLVTSIPMGFARAVEKLYEAQKLYSLEDILTGKVKLNELNEEVSERIRKGPKKVNPTKQEEPNKPVVFEDVEKCPDCGSELVREEGCMKCPICGFSKC